MFSLRLLPSFFGPGSIKHIYREEVKARCLTLFVLLVSGFRAIPLDAWPALTLRRHP